MIYIPKHFKAQELVSPKFYKIWGDTSFQWIDSGLLHDLDIIRNKVKEKWGTSLVINDWSWGGSYIDSGLRSSDSSYYSPTSAHSFGKAADIKLGSWVSGDFSIPTNDLIDLIKELKNSGELIYINRLELDTNFWVHIDTFNREPNENNLFVFKP